MRLFIAEKPSVARAIAEELGVTARGEGFIACGESVVTWCFGHLLEQADADTYTPDSAPRAKNGRKLWRFEDLPIIPATWVSCPKADAKKQLAIIRRLLSDANLVVHAGDPDREGQLIIDEVLEHVGARKPVQRFWVSAQDPVSIRRGLETLRDNRSYAGLTNAARARQRADWLIGINLSRAYTLSAKRDGSRVLLTVGRVQTPTLALVVARDREIEAFKPQPYHTIEARLQHSEGAFVGTWRPSETQLGLDEEGRLINPEIADAIVAMVTGKSGSITSFTTQPKKKPAPLCFSLADITVLASQKWGCSAEQVLRACQALYETHKLTTYPKTDSGYLPEAQHADAPDVLAAVRHVNPHLASDIDRADPRLVSPTWNDSKVTAHHAIVPTRHFGSSSALSRLEQQIYDLIVRRYLAQFYPSYEYVETRVTVDVAGETFAATGRSVVCHGWREIDLPLESDPGDRAESEPAKALPAMRPTDAVVCLEARRKDAETKPPARFTEGSLVRAIEQIHKWVSNPEHKKLLRESDGIGTAATRAAILSDLRRRKFLAARGPQVISTRLGRALVGALPEVVKSATLTALYERMLKAVELGEVELDAFVGEQARFVTERVAEAGRFVLPPSAGLTFTPTRAVRRRPAARRSRIYPKEKRHG